MVFSRELSRRDFLKLSAGSTAALGLALYSFPNFEQLLAESAKNTPVIWLQGGSCTGCSISFLNSLSPKVQDVLVNKVIPGNQLSLRFHPNVMAGQGDIAMQAMEDTAKNKGGFVLIVEGTIPTKDGGVYSEVGEKDGHGVTILEHVTTLGRDAMAVISVGACSAFGGIPAAVPNPTGSKSVKAVFDENGIQTPVINIPGCPPHPDWLVSTVATILIGGLGAVDLDSIGRPRAFFSELIHDRCPRRGFFDAGKFSKRYSEPYCMFELGCKGPVTRADCGVRLWNSGTNWCVGCNSICIGCCEPGFPDSVSPFSKVSNLAMVAPPAWLPPIDQVSEEPDGLSTGMVVGLGVAGGAIAGAAITAALGATRKQSSQEEE